jgi:photosystem II stability/assembly factor-like uncharacterized protein
VVSPRVAWIGGTRGTYARTRDGGATWHVNTVPGAEALDFRDVEAFGETTAYLLSAGPGEHSRIYKTMDGGQTWTLQFKNTDSRGFYDAFAFWDQRSGIALGDPVDGKAQLLVSEDGGSPWRRLSPDDLPPCLPGEAAFAASGTCLVTQGESDVWFCTGGAERARVFHSADRGRHWTVRDTPIAAGAPSAGIFSIAFRDRKRGVIVGGDYRKPNERAATTAVTQDGGKTWSLVDPSLPYRSAVAWTGTRWIAVGTSGSDWSADDGATWKPIDQQNYNSIAWNGAGWAVGPGGRVAKFLAGSP